MAGYGKRFFGIGFDKWMGMEAMQPYMQTMAGGRTAIRRMGYAGANVSVIEATARQGRRRFGQLAREAPGVFRRRRIAGGVGAAVGLAGISSTIGLGEAATLGAGVGVGVAAGRYFGRAGGKASRVAFGGRWGGRLGFAAAGVGLMTGML
jgi:hypothetical protein